MSATIELPIRESVIAGELAKLANALMASQLEWLTSQFRQMGKTEEAPELALQLLAQLQGTTVLTHVFTDPNMFTRQIANAKSWLYELV